MRCFKLCKKGSTQLKVNGKPKETGNNVNPRYSLLPEHELHNSHEIMQINDISLHNSSGVVFIPRVIGTKIPRKNNILEYSIFMISHFKPFSARTSILESASFIDEYRSYTFHQHALKIMANWEEIHECEDAREAERLKKRDKTTRESRMLLKSVSELLNDEDYAEMSGVDQFKSMKDVKLQQVIERLKASGWLDDNVDNNGYSDLYITNTVRRMYTHISVMNIKMLQVKQWQKDIKSMERMLISSRQNALNVTSQVQIIPTIKQTDMCNWLKIIQDDTFDVIPSTVSLASSKENPSLCDPLVVLHAVAKHSSLNEMQLLHLV